MRFGTRSTSASRWRLSRATEHAKRLALLLGMAALAGCATRIGFETETSMAPLPVADYAAEEAGGAVIYRVIAEDSELLVRVGRAGRMAHLGHDHAVASDHLQGYVAVHADRGRSRADLAMPLRDLVVDRARDRARLELDSEPSADDIAGPYSNMRRVVEAETWPWATVAVRMAGAEETLLDVSIDMHGQVVELRVPAELEIDAERVRVSGEFRVSHADFGLVPFTAAGGLIRVADELDVRFRVVAERTSLAEASAG